MTRTVHVTISNTVRGEGFTATTIDGMGDQPGFRKLRHELGITAFGANAIVFPPHVDGRWHWHDEQEEVYIVLRGTMTLELRDHDPIELPPGGVARVDPHTVRRVSNRHDDELVVIALGGKDGYVARDGHQPDD